MRLGLGGTLVFALVSIAGGCGRARYEISARDAGRGDAPANGECATGRADCDEDPSNGCETSLDSALHCGGCGETCAFDNALAGCSEAACVVTGCHPGWGDCNGSPGDGCETSLATARDCGACGRSCEMAGAVAACVEGRCELAGCAAGRADCNGAASDGCESDLTSTEHCGECGNACELANATAACVDGGCAVATCDPYFADCNDDAADGCETDLRRNGDCGACGTICVDPSPLCGELGGGSYGCTSTCSGAAPSECAGSCVDLTTSVSHCGSCGNACAFTNAAAACVSGRCQLSMCNAGFESCDGLEANGCETRLDTLSNCGSCGATCALANAAETCTDGTCRVTACDAPWGDCDGVGSNGCETSLTTVTHCGGCEVPCNAANATGESCATGSCTYTCDPGWSDCDGNASNGCECNTAGNANACFGGACVPPVACPGTPEVEEWNGHLYTYCHSGRPWTIARDECRVWGGDLAVADTEAEYQFFITFAEAGWLGLNDRATEGTFVWDGQPASFTGYRLWCSGQPDDAGGGEDCVVFNWFCTANNGLTDYDCGGSHWSVCERD